MLPGKRHQGKRDNTVPEQWRERPTILANPGSKQWVCAGRAVDEIRVVDMKGKVVYPAPLPWLAGMRSDGKRIDVVGLLGTGTPRIVKDVRTVKVYRAMCPILVRKHVDMSDVDNRHMWDSFVLILPVPGERFHKTGSGGRSRPNEIWFDIHGVAEDAGRHQPERYLVDQFRVLQEAR